ncbi:MAG: Protein of unknown function (DUF1553)/Protein of unknown function (DUF1549)/Planctomycete [Bryobacterales bacterium]|nr:Protein of unknown function (DUF1553)/Protein of unknown function (DUF1549)/Planctomycete [Bryobacterales bacterium]
MRAVFVLITSGLLPSAVFAAVDFQRQVRPILSENCFLCHGPDQGTRMADLRLDTREGTYAARKDGVTIVPGKPDESLLIKRVFAETPAMRMPPLSARRTLTPKQKDILKSWIEEGAQWKEHWAFVNPVRPVLPPVKDASRIRNPIDRFVLAKLDANGAQLAPEADRNTLIRRVTLDLTGLPPTPAEVDAFLKDRSPNAYERVVDRLLASLRYGEHRARYWLDAARYADTQGLHIDNYREMWPYRDWVIDAFNRNMSFDRFTVEQLAGDLLPNATLDQKVGSGFQRCNVTTNEGGSIPEEVAAMYAKDRADTTGTVWMGLTVGCATCHDHKFDPISQKDFYALTAFYRNTTQNPLDGNIPDTPPTVIVPPAKDRSRWEELNRERARLQQTLATAEANAKTGSVTQPWEQSWVVLNLSPEKLSLPDGVTIGDGVAGSDRALHFGADAFVTLPNVSAIDTDKPFTIATWAYLPKAKPRYVIASQYEPEPLETPKDDRDRRRGWIIDFGGQGPSIKLAGTDGKYLSAKPDLDYELKPETWYHLVFTYDGSRDRNGLSLYVNGKSVPASGTGEDNDPLETSIRSDAPLKLGNDKKRFFSGGAIAEFRTFRKRADEQEAELLALWNTVAIAGSKDPSQLSDAERHALANYHILQSDPAAAELRKINAERNVIARRSAVTFVMQERTGSQPVAHILNRGQYDQLKEEVRADVPAVLPPMRSSFPRNRLGLAEWLVDPSNPLTARVTVNRFWQEVFGTGLVRTAEDFGSQGEPPSHPELLDWLVVEFRESGWDVKKLFRLIVTSAAYRQSATATEEKLQRDPDNRLISRGPRLRMDAEAVRDYALAAGGLLTATIGGPSVKPYQPANVWETIAMDNSNTRFYHPDTGAKLYRRSMYTFWKRSAPPASMDIFNAPSREVCTVRRERTNTPLQALVTMNDPQFVEAARALAQNALIAAHGNANRGFDYMAIRLLARRLDARERDVVTRSYHDYLSYYDSNRQDAAKLLSVGESKADSRLSKPEFAAMTMVANQLFNLDEVLVK